MKSPGSTDSSFPWGSMKKWGLLDVRLPFRSVRGMTSQNA